jgi:ribosomal protein S18 acetylase RimI-like enzyme
MRANQAGGGRHVCNCGYITDARTTGRGITRAMCLHSLDHGRSRGYRAMHVNFVVSTNERGVRLWQLLCFEIVGRLPGTFRGGMHGLALLLRTASARFPCTAMAAGGGQFALAGLCYM